MARADILLPHILRWEGGFVNDPADAGGATNMGVTLATYDVYCQKKGYPRPTVERLKVITREQVFDVFKTLYWDRWQADQIQNQKIANILVDWVWCSGKHGIVIPQRILGVQADGIVGNKTLSVVNFADPNQLFAAIYKARVDFLNEITQTSIANYEKKIGHKATEKELLTHTNKRFLKGWLNRLESIKTL